MKIRIVVSALTALVVVACSHSWRVPASSGQRFLALGPLSKSISSEITSSQLKPENCSRTLSEMTAYLEHYDLADAVKDLSPTEAEVILQNLWSSRVKLHDRLSELAPSCHAEIRKFFVTVRSVEDYVAEVVHKIPSMDPAKIEFQKELVPLKETSPRYMTFYREKGRTFELREGDILLTRGVTFLSAMISRIGEDSQFSHVVMVGKDPKDGQLKTIESYVGAGVNFYDMDYALKNENARIFILRPRDPKVAALSAEKIAQLVRERLNHKNKIKYDYSLDFSDRKTLSCAEVSQYAFEMGSEGKMHIPQYPSRLNPNSDLLKNLGIQGGTTYAPGDLETDPRFELIGEFRDLGIVRDSRQKDAILSSMVHWMDDHGYELRRNIKAKMALPIWLIRRTFLWPLVRRALKIQDFSKEVPVRMLRTMSMMNDIGEVLLNVVKHADHEYEKKNGVPMSYAELMQVLEKFRRDDLTLYEDPKTSKNSTLHKLFRPDSVVKNCQRKLGNSTLSKRTVCD